MEPPADLYFALAIHKCYCTKLSFTLSIFSIPPTLLKDMMARKPADPEEELRWMSQEVRGYVEAVLNSLAANVPKVSLYYQLCIFHPHSQFVK